MRRPLFVAALLFAAAAAVCVETGLAERVPPGYVSTAEFDTACELLVTGEVYQKDDQSIYLKSVKVSEKDAPGQPAAGARQEMQMQGQSQKQGQQFSQIQSNQIQSSQVQFSQIQSNQIQFSQIQSGISVKENLICEVERAQEIPLGCIVAVEGVFMPFSRATNPGEFDAFVYYRTLKIGGKLRKAEVLGRTEDRHPVREGLYQLRCRLKERIYHVFPEREAAVMSALLLGDKGELDSEWKELYKRNGILHILSISSLHITILGMGMYKLLRRVGVPIVPAALGGSVLLVLYGCMTGFGVSACRAIGMYLIRMLGEMAGRTYDMLTALGLTGALMTAGNPYYLQNGGFLLSFTSVLGLGVICPALMSKWPGRAENPAGKLGAVTGKWGTVAGKLWEALFGSAAASLSITLATLPVQLWLYYEIPVYSVFLNLLVIPLVKPMMITGLLSLVPGLGLFGWVGRAVLGCYELLCTCFDRLPFHTWNPGCPDAAQIVIYYLLLLGAAAMRSGQKKKRSRKERENAGGAGIDRGREGKDRGREEKERGRRKEDRAIIVAKVAAKIPVCLICLAVLTVGYSPAGENSAAFLDVGQGDCILLETASGQTYLFDCGSSNRSSVGKYVLLPYLKYNGIRDIDGIFLSHPDEDHVNGVLELLETGAEHGIRVRQLLLPAIEEEARAEELGELLGAAEAAGERQKSPVSVGYLAAGDSWDCGSAVFTCLHPSRGFDGENANAYSECFYVEFYEGDSGGFRNREDRESGPRWTLLLTGDVEGKGERALESELAARGIGGVSVLKAAHHGSRNSTSRALLSSLRPGLTVISCGRRNRYGHPHEELLQRLEEAETYVMRTDRSGAVTVRYRGGLQVEAVQAETPEP